MSGTIGPSSSSPFASAPPLAYRIPDVPSGPEPSFGAPTPAPSAPRASGGLFSLEPYKVYFDLDTADVLHRMRLACLPLGSNFTTAVQDNPDLYGPFWIAATLVFLSSATGNLASYYAYRGTGAWTYDIQKVTLSALLFYGYITVVPLVWYICFRYWGAQASPTALVTLYGYSLTIFLPISLLCAIPNELLRWIIVFSGGMVACLFITLNMRRQLETFEDQKRKSIVLMLAGSAQFGLAVALALEFFSYGGTLAPS